MAPLSTSPSSCSAESCRLPLQWPVGAPTLTPGSPSKARAEVRLRVLQAAAVVVVVGVVARRHQADTAPDPMCTDPIPCRPLDRLAVLPLLAAEAAAPADTAAGPTIRIRPDQDPDRLRPDDGGEAEEEEEEATGRIDMMTMIPAAAAGAAASAASEARRGLEAVTIDERGWDCSLGLGIL